MDAKRDPIQVMARALEEIRRHQVALHDPALTAYLRDLDLPADTVDAFLALARQTLH